MSSSERRPLPDLSSRAYEHPADRAALVALRALPGFETVVRKVVGAVGERGLRFMFLASAVRVGERQLPQVHARYRTVCRLLDVDPAPELFVAQTPLVNAGAIGLDRPFIVLNSGTLQLLDEDEVEFVLGHELGHVLSGHALYKTVLHILLRVSSLAFGIPLGGAAILAITAALLEWDRCSELSADRAGLLAVQSPDVALRTNMKMAGGAGPGLNLDAFVEQADEYRANDSLGDSLLKTLLLLGRTHPFPVLRIAELKRWVESGEYKRLVDGDYARRSEDASASIRDAMGSAARTYGDALKNSSETIGRAMRRVAMETRAVQKAVRAALRDYANKSDDKGEVGPK
jgi:Zn-dependent protease with chaperone function